LGYYSTILGTPPYTLKGSYFSNFFDLNLELSVFQTNLALAPYIRLDEDNQNLARKSTGGLIIIPERFSLRYELRQTGEFGTSENAQSDFCMNPLASTSTLKVTPCVYFEYESHEKWIYLYYSPKSLLFTTLQFKLEYKPFERLRLNALGEFGTFRQEEFEKRSVLSAREDSKRGEISTIQLQLTGDISVDHNFWINYRARDVKNNRVISAYSEKMMKLGVTWNY